MKLDVGDECVPLLIASGLGFYEETLCYLVKPQSRVEERRDSGLRMKPEPVDGMVNEEDRCPWAG